MSPASDRPTAPASSLEAMVRELARQEAQAAVRAALQDAPGSRPRFTTLSTHARRCGLGTSTLRRWAAAAGVRRSENGRYVTAELDDVVRRGGKAAPEAAPAAPADLAAERARRAVETLTRRGRR